MPLSSVVPVVGRRPNPQITRLIESDPIGGFLPANDSQQRLAPPTEEEGGGSGSRSGSSGSSGIDRKSLNSDDEDGNAVKIPLTRSSRSSGDAEIQLENFEPSRGLSKTELLQYVDDPYWKRVRIILFISFWVLWISMIIASAVILGLSPKCPSIPKLSWWQKTPFYRVKPEMFFDANADGVGDLQGLTKKLNYVGGLHVKALLVDDIFQEDNLKDVDEKLGTIADWDVLVKSAHKKGMFVVLDLDPTTVSKSHPWFLASGKSGLGGGFYRDFFVWSSSSSSSSLPSALTWPNGESIWAFDAFSRRFYLRSSVDDSPLLNLASKAVRSEVEDVLDYWLSKGADGFSLRGGDHLALFENAAMDRLPDSVDPIEGGVSEIIAGWKSVFESHRELTQRPRLLMLDASAAFDRLYNDVDLTVFEGLDEGVDVVLRASVIAKMDRLPVGADHCDSSCLKQAVDASHEAVGEKQGEEGEVIKWRAEAIGGGKMTRFATRVGTELYNAYMIVLGLLPGTPILYYGDEIGMLQSPTNNASTPMQWTSDSATAGFTSSSKGPAVPLAPSSETFNVQMQRALGSDHTKLDLVEELMELRQEPSVAWGKIFESSMDNQIYSYLRQAQGFPGYLVAVNVGTAPSLIDFAKPSLQVPATGIVVITTKNFAHQEFSEGSKLRLDKVYLRPGEGVVVKLEANVVQDDVVVNGH